MNKNLSMMQKIVDNKASYDETTYLDDFTEYYKKLIHEIALNYTNYRSIVPNLLYNLEKDPINSIVIQLYLFFDSFEIIFSNINKNNKDSFEEDLTSLEIDTCFGIVKDLMIKSKKNPRLLDATSFTVEAYNDSQLFQLEHFIVDILQQYSENTVWDKNVINTAIIHLFFLRSIGLKKGDLDIFYFACDIVADRIITSGENQIARDFAEEIMILGYNDNMKDLAFLGASRIYTNCHNGIAGLLFANIHLICLESRAEISTKYAFKILWQILKCLREVKIMRPKEIDLLQKHVNNLNISNYDRDAFQHSLFTCKLYLNDPDLPSLINDYLDEHRERIINNGTHGVIPWYITLKNIQNEYPEHRCIGLNIYLKLFDSIIDKKQIQLYEDVLNENNLEYQLKSQLIKLGSTRSSSDFTKDNDFALKIANRFIQQTVNNRNIVGFLLCMCLKSDFSFVFSDKKPLNNAAPISKHEFKPENIEFYYENDEIFRSYLKIEPNDEILWLGTGDDHVFEMSLIKWEFYVTTIKTWSLQKFKKKINNGELKLTFESSTRDNTGTIYIKSESEYENESSKIKNEFLDYIIEIDPNSDRYLIIKDIELSGFPHNLFIDSTSNRFIGELKPTINALSTESLILSKTDTNLNNNYTKSFWCPVDSEIGQKDIPLKLLYSKIEDILKSESVIEEKNLYPTIPVKSELNIICAHGGDDIRNEQVFYAAHSPITDLNMIIGKGKILILLICHSGSMGKSTYDNCVHSLIKKYSREGYSSIIAPMWSLPIDIVPIWLSSFFSEINAGKFVIDAHFKANMAVKEIYPVPSAWACLHLFGNPYIKINNNISEI